MSCPERGKGKQGKGENKGENQEKGKGKMGKGLGKEKGLQSMNEWDEWCQTDEYTRVPILSMSCGEEQPEIKSPALSMTSEKWASSDEASEVDVHQDQIFF